DCTDGIDNDGDLVFDCGDADCKDHPACQPSGASESTDALCSDWVDNDGDGYLDCDDLDCRGTTACMGSWDLPATKGPSPVAAGRPDVPTTFDEALAADEGAGERDNVTCSDGIDNDGDGLIDCDDFGCRLDSSVTVC